MCYPLNNFWVGRICYFVTVTLLLLFLFLMYSWSFLVIRPTILRPTILRSTLLRPTSLRLPLLCLTLLRPTSLRLTLLFLTLLRPTTQCNAADPYVNVTNCSSATRPAISHCRCDELRFVDIVAKNSDSSM